MPSAPLPSDEAQRLVALRSLDLLDTPASEVFNSFVRVASRLFAVPLAAISLVDADRQWFKATVGLPMSETSRDASFSAHVILQPDEVLWVPDARLDPRFCDNPNVLGASRIRFYAGVSLIGEDGHAVGTLSIADQTPRLLNDDEIASLRDLATGVSAAIRLHGMMRRLELDARSDPLTSLGNRREFETSLKPFGSESVALFLLDLDGFKGINDVFGHPGGDLALQEVGRRLQAVIRSGDCAFRLGGDEFALICPGMASAEARFSLAERIHAAMADTFMIDGQTVPLRTSIGIAVLPDHAGSPQELVHLADVALYDAKRAGRGTTRQAGGLPAGSGEAPSREPGLPVHGSGSGIGLISLAERLRRALVPGGSEPFTLVFQPVVALSTQRTSSLEALVRWDLGPDGAIPASEFVTLTERLGLIAHLDRWVLAAACKAAAGWPEPWLVSVNVSALSFGLVDVVAMVEDALATSGLPAARLVIEITETAFGGDVSRAREAVEGIRALGARISLDDFGAGHGSLSTLRQLPFTGMKIDRSLVADIGTDSTAAHMVRLIADFGCALDVRVVAEGVETVEQLCAVAECGVSLVQGYLLAKPTVAGDVVTAVRDAERIVAAALAGCIPPERLAGVPQVMRSRVVEAKRAGYSGASVAAPDGGPPTASAVLKLPKHPALRPGSSAAGGAIHALVVEDELLVALLVEELLTDAGYQVTTAVDGLDACRLLADTSFDIVLTDVRMPRLDGVGLVRHLREKHPELPAVVFSGQMSEKDRLTLLELGVPAGAILEKPQAFPALHLALRRALNEAAPQPFRQT
ncbi:EAL domain-containing protein [Muricoccus aerilatus]|uniref:EAL domain-containing protein n=1 Tax=Muricoccus aerilatus TaxID=452982 RepID=UPI000693A381|nr:EAL domain-containing protein [Roseomonas aerilata]